MSDVIATVWDFDKTLIPGYMQDPIFKRFKVDAKSFWAENEAEIKKLIDQKMDVHKDSYYLNRFIRLSQPGRAFDGLNNQVLRELGAKLEFYPGAVELFQEIQGLNSQDPYREFGIKFENYIVSTGFKKMIQGSQIADHVKHIWGAELIDVMGEDGKTRISEIAYSLDNTTKTRALFEINKGVGIVTGSTIDVNTKIPNEQRRVQFCNMVYVADGPSDVPAFSVLKQKGGATMAVYPKGDEKAFREVDRLQREDRVDMIAEADYSKGSGAYLWLMTRLKDQAQQIIDRIKAPYAKAPGTPPHQV